ncbi:MAG: heparan-alpha-glucosaminide N-acetyltransferase domain-containing protein [Myxococcales bacterium]|nr:heparan-alpha-glucosaminide N-acetyltransferase domain-containing protein [Myxococcales bacterium]
MQRDRAVDWARGVAALAMIEGHATHGWASEAARQSAAYGVTRLVATSPLPAFMLLAGMALRLRVGAAEARGEGASALRRSIARRGMTVLLWGYASSVLYALLDGHQGLRTLLRADVLHVIGLSIASVAWLCVAGGAGVCAAAATRRALWLSLAVMVLSPLYYGLGVGPAEGSALGYLLAPLIRVPGVTIFPLLPMLVWTTLGFAVGDVLARARQRHSLERVYGSLAALALAVAICCQWLQRWLLGDGGVLDYVHPAAIPNAVGYAARGLVLIGVGPLLVARLPAGVQDRVTRLGQASLVAYIVHIPFCYGLPSRPLKGSLGMLECVPWVLSLWLLSYAAIAVVERVGQRGRELRQLRGPAHS